MEPVRPCRVLLDLLLELRAFLRKQPQRLVPASLVERLPAGVSWLLEVLLPLEFPRAAVTDPSLALREIPAVLGEIEPLSVRRGEIKHGAIRHPEYPVWRD